LDLIEKYIETYTSEFENYEQISRFAALKIEDELLQRGIRAIVTYRAKRPERLKAKLIKRNQYRNYLTPIHITEDIVDLAGVRISLYFPSDRNLMAEIISELFHILKIKHFPKTTHEPKYDKRFSGYWATHYRINLKKELAREKELKVKNKFLLRTIEIQIASVLMHSWSEVEHDLIYKPLVGELSKEEYSILDEINGLVISGEIALERLQSAMAERMRTKNEIQDPFDLTNYLVSQVKRVYTGEIKLGDIHLLNNYIHAVRKMNITELNHYLEQVNLNQGESITDQLLQVILQGQNSEDNFKAYFKNLNISEPRISDFERFIKGWGILEMVVKEVVPSGITNSLTDFNDLIAKSILNKTDVDALFRLKKIRNKLLHGVDSPSVSLLKLHFSKLSSLISKIISHHPDQNTSTSILEKLKEL
jgi:ppGpp synthetase/RelA/SpoT-type nucleotidyltranferase